MPKWYCCVPGCKAAETKRKRIHKYPWMAGLRFFPLPAGMKNLYSRTKWLSLIRREDTWVPSKYTRVCSRHFVGEDGPTLEHPLPTLFPYNKWGQSQKPCPKSTWAIKRESTSADSHPPQLEAWSPDTDSEVQLLPQDVVPECSSFVEVGQKNDTPPRTDDWVPTICAPNTSSNKKRVSKGRTLLLTRDPNLNGKFQDRYFPYSVYPGVRKFPFLSDHNYILQESDPKKQKTKTIKGVQYVVCFPHGVGPKEKDNTLGSAKDQTQTHRWMVIGDEVVRLSNTDSEVKEETVVSDGACMAERQEETVLMDSALLPLKTEIKEEPLDLHSECLQLQMDSAQRIEAMNGDAFPLKSEIKEEPLDLQSEFSLLQSDISKRMMASANFFSFKSEIKEEPLDLQSEFLHLQWDINQRMKAVDGSFFPMKSEIKEEAKDTDSRQVSLQTEVKVEAKSV